MFNIKQPESMEITQRKHGGMPKQVPGDKTRSILSFPACISMQIGFPKTSADGRETEMRLRTQTIVLICTTGTSRRQDEACPSGHVVVFYFA